MLIFTLVLKYKRAYHQACKVRDQTERLYKEACVEGSTVNEEQVKKLKDKSDKAANDVQVRRHLYILIKGRHTEGRGRPKRGLISSLYHYF